MIDKHNTMYSIMSACPICGSSAWRARDHTLVRCFTCGLVATATPHFQDDLTLYDATYYSDRNAYLSSEQEFLPIYLNILDRLRPFKVSGSLLDVGCGVGQLIAAANDRGYQGSGCDVSQWATNYARSLGLDVHTGRIDELEYPTASYDVVVLNHTLEHIAELRVFLQELHRILADDGILVVGVPNFGGLFSTLMRSRWAGLLPDQHYWHFTAGTLRQLLTVAGFSVKKIYVEPHIHRHQHLVKNIALRALSQLATWTRSSDDLLAIACKS